MNRNRKIRKDSHCDKILTFLEIEGNSLTSWECIDHLRIQNLPQRIKKLEQYGYIIDRKTENDEEMGITYTRYSLVKDINNG